jgi:hypothetical protein
MAAQAWFSSGDIAVSPGTTTVAPGTTTVLQLTVVNLGDTTDSFVLTPVGMAASWSTIRPATITLFGGTQEIVDVEVSPPLLPSTPAGPVSLSVRVVPQGDPDDIASAETSLVIGESFDRRINMLQPAMRGRRTATFEMMLENKGNTLASCRLHLVDGTGRVEAEFDPPAAGIEPGASTLVRAKVRAKSLQWERRPRSIPFKIDADQPGSPTASASATFVQAPVVAEHLWTRVAGVAIVASLAAVAWFGVVKPAIRTAADDAVRRSVPTTTTLAPGVTVVPAPGNTADTGNTTPTTAPSGGLPADGSIVNVPLPVSVKQGQTGANQYTVPAGKKMRITDLVIQNPQLDQGTLIVARNDSALFTYSLTNMFNDVDRPLVTPIELAAGEQLVVTVTCVGVGDQTATACSPKVLLSGVLLPSG